MAAVSRGDKTKRAFKVVKRKKATESHKNHRFESFNQRIAKLNIDPVRRTTSTYQDLADQDLSASTSHFRVALDEWSDKNLTEQFSNFLRDAEPLSETLPQLLHHQERVADLLLSYIENAPTTSLEPLLDLLAQFAHDLGERFETFFERSVCTLATIARTNPDIEAIEWSLNAVVWLFKYLSRLLVPDLRPTYDLLAPLLGREKQKPFIARFAAEGFSFLLKKAGLGYNKGQEPLKKIVGHILQDLRDTDGNELYQQGLMTLFADSMRGVQRGLHSAALPILKELLRVSLEKTNDSGNNARRTVIHGVLISLIHHCDGDSFAPALQTVLDATEVPVGAPTEIDVQMSIRFLFELAGVRSGSRITNWKIIFERLQALFDLIEQSPVTHESLCADALASAAVIFQHCPLGEAYPFLRLLERTTSTFWKPHFISFCMFFADMGSERFKTMLLPRLQKFVLAEWQSSPTELVALLTSLTPLGVLESKSVAGAKVERDVVEGFRRLRGEVQNDPPDMGLLHLCNSELDIFELLEPSKQKREDSLVIVAQNVLADFAPRTSELNLYWHFAFGRCFEFLCQTHPTRSETTSALNRALSLSAGFVGLLPYWRSVHQYLSNLDSTAFEQIPGFDGLLESSVRCLALPSHQIRLCGLRVLYHSFRLQGKPIPAILETALAIEESPFDIHNVRLISMRIRKLAAEFKHVSSDPLLCRAIPTYCFGLLHVHLTQAWNDASAALKEMCEEKTSEDVVAQLALKWMEGSEAEWDEMHDEQADHVAESQQRRFYTDFECSHLERLDELHASCLEKAATPKEQLKSRFEKTHRQVPEVTTACRAQALRVLRLIPHVAERRSRLLVPLFLDWAQNAQADDFDTSDNEDSIPRSADLCKQRWNRKDQKSMVSLLSTFTNPRVLYQSEAVHASFLSLLCNGDAELQKPALQALLAWKPPAVEPYREELFKFLDNDRFREQLSVFLGVGSEDSVIKDEHRQVLMPVLLRVLYGRMIAKGGAAAKGGGLESRRKAVFIELTRFGDETLSQFLSISLGPLGTLELLLDGEVNDEALGKELMTPRKQQGLLNMLKDMLTTLKKSFSALAKHLIEPILYCLFRAAAIMGAGEADSMVHSVRQMSLQCLVTMFEQFPDLQWVAYIRPIFYRFINQRLANLSVETAHSISGLMKLFGAWAAAAETAPFLFQYNDEVVPQLAKCLTPESAKDDVKSFVLQLLRQLGYVAASTPVAKEGLQRHGKDLLAAIETVLRGHAPKEVLDLAIDTVQVLAPSIPKDQCIGLIEICTFLLQQPPKRVRPKTKGEILQALIPIFSHVANAVSDIDVVDGFEGLSAGFELAFDLQGRVDPVSENTQAGQLIRGTYSALSSLFAYFEDQENRTRLAELFELLVNPVPSLRTIAAVAQDLNSFSDSRVGEPDFQRRSEAVDIIRSQSQAWSLHQWMPIVHTLLFHVKDEDDGIRANASLGLKRFVEASAVAADETKEDGFSRFTEEVLLPSINRGLQQRAYSELVRADYLAVLAHTINHLRGLESIHDMQCLLSSDDEEASFFVNILHIQQHRRLRALRRLVKEVQNGSIMSRNISRFFIPLIEHFVFDPHEDENAHNLTAEAITTIGHLSGWLEWSQYRALLKRYSSFVERKHALEKTMMKLLGVLVDALCRAERDNGGAEDTAEPEIDMVQASTALPHSRLGATLPSRTRLSEELQKSILPQLSGYLHHKDEATVSRRVPVAITIAKMLRVLPEAEFTMRLPPMLMDLSHILRSRSQESRDLTRKTFAEITALIGSMHFGFVLKELRRALQYGYQLHVLSFTVHSILVSTSTKFNLGDLDYCVNDIVNIIVDDIFGATGQEKDAEDYISKMKEVKSSKSYDSMELVARITTLGHLMDLIRPIQNLLYERLNDRMVKKIDELLRRLRQGLAKNEAATDQNILKFCHEIWSEASSTSPADKPAKFADQRTKRYLVNMKAAHKASYRGTTTAQTSRLVRFAIDVLRDMIPKNENFQTPANLTGFVELIGKAIAADDEDIKTAAMRLVTSIIRVVRHPFQKLDEGAAAYAREAMRVVRNAQSTNTESAQAALRMATEILQKRHDAAIRDHDIAFLLKALKNDLQDAQRQNTAFGFVRAVINRRVVIPEVHETMTQMREIMIQSHSRESRKLARDVYFAFLMSPEYFQGKGREKQIAFLVKNLAFEHAEGRQSVMEILHLLLTKENEKNIDGIHDMVFVPLVMSMANDDSEQCRTLAEILIKAVFERAIESRMKAFLKMIRDWTRKEDLAPQQTGFRCWTAYVEVKQQSAEKNSDFVKSAQQLLEAKVSEAKARQPDVESGELLYFALKALETYVKLNNKATTNAAFTPNKEQLWSLICECQFFPHVWVKLIAAQLVSLYLSDFAAHNAKASFGTAPLPGSGGLELQKDRMFQITRACLRILSIEEAEIEPKEELLAQAIKSLAFMARCFASNRLLWTSDRYSDPGAGVDEDKENDIDIDDDDQGEDDGEDLHHKPALQFLIGRLAAVLRRTPRRSHSTGMRAHKGAMQLLSNLCSNIEVEYLEGCLPMILRSLHNLIDPSITHVSDHHGGALILSFSALQDSARELLRLLQNKLGTDTYLAAMSKVKAVAKEKREDRRAKRRIEAVSMPEKVATVKRKKREHAREKRKEKNQAMRGMRRGW